MGMGNEVNLAQLGKAIEKLKQDIATKEGEIKAEMKGLTKDFGFKTLDEAYKALKKLEAEIEDNTRELQRDSADVYAKLKEYGYV